MVVTLLRGGCRCASTDRKGWVRLPCGRGAGSGWVVGAPTAWQCGDGRTLLTLACPACALTAASTLEFHLP
jgi:hypothetical protein